MLKIDDYAYSSVLKDVHPVEKVGFAFAFLLFTIITKNMFIAFITFFVMSITIVLAAKISLVQYIKFLFLPSFFLFSSVIAIIVSIAPVNSVITDAIWNIEMGAWQIYISLSNLKQAYHLSATVIASVSCLYFLILTTPLNQLIWILQKVKLPTLFIELVALTYRFIFVLLDKMHEIYLAQSSRLGYKNYRVWIISAAQLIVSLFIKSIQSAKEVQIAIESRSGGEGLYEIELNLNYNRLHCATIFFSMTGLFTLTILT
ncbi:cobalt ECF transporter T component CbiQ [Bacillus taeanensis]|uniref:Cobalt ECF transporter T component CbiQ n=1 Tax=Bacillus taeanensis TaxID=273032 RepID=A0A366XRX4_9BACI|nr:cobalt ECF transporter T component CbiQ [Bacillus taeanensis]RBW67875.1 cobalt ECF transporter T component CbiQ [Bacillus taeanensis]